MHHLRKSSAALRAAREDSYRTLDKQGFTLPPLPIEQINGANLSK